MTVEGSRVGRGRVTGWIYVSSFSETGTSEDISTDISTPNPSTNNMHNRVIPLEFHSEATRKHELCKFGFHAMCIFLCMSLSLSIYISIYIYIYTHYMYTYKSVCMYVYMSVHMYICMHAHM